MRFAKVNEVFPVVDAVGGTSPEATARHWTASSRAGATCELGPLICELQRDWQRKEPAQEFANILFAVEGH